MVPSLSGRRHSEFEIEQQIFLGGQISGKYKDFLEIAKVSPDYADIIILIKKMPEIEKEPDPEKQTLIMLEALGMVDFVRNCTELTRLSMVMGDTRKRYSFKGLKDAIQLADGEPAIQSP
jgi:hypothetical protein